MATEPSFIYHEIRKRDEACEHEWSEVDGQTDMEGACLKCGLSFMAHIHTECE